jgi:acetylornithine/N-succinyldiaminopimelate aminotransferase
VVAAALGLGLVVNAPRPDTIRLAPSLLVSDAEVDEALGLLAAALADVAATAAAPGPS